MTAPSIQALIEALPKAELHVHIEGCIEVRAYSSNRAALSQTQHVHAPKQGVAEIASVTADPSWCY